MSPDVVVVGAGAAGIIAAWRAATLGANVLLIEKTNRIGTKIMISGGGKCNITHDGPIEAVLKAFRQPEARFLRPSFYRYTNQQVLDLLHDRGLETMVRPDGRVFPVNGTAKDVVGILISYLEEAGVEVWKDSQVTKISKHDDHFTIHLAQTESKQRQAEHRFGSQALLQEVLAQDQCAEGPQLDQIDCANVIIATGGSSYPNSGTTGDGWPWMREMGHTVTPIRAALAPINLTHKRTDWSGVALRDIILRARKENREIAKWRGDVLFTHTGISGPCALGISRIVAESMIGGKVILEVDLQPNTYFEQLNDDLLKTASQNPRRQIRQAVHSMAPERVIEDILDQCGIRDETVGSNFTKPQRSKLVQLLKAYPLGPVSGVPLEKGEVVAGGVSLDEVDPKTMASLKCEGLYLCGEILDIAGPVGGYNLQAAFSTGFVAAESVAQRLNKI